MGVVYVLRLPLLKAMRTLHGQLATKFKQPKNERQCAFIQLCNHGV